MNKEQIIRAWKDEEYRSGLSEGELGVMPQHPAGIIELSDIEMSMADGREEELTSLVVVTVTLIACIPALSVVVSALTSSWQQGGTCKLGGLGCTDVDHLAG